MGYLQQDTNNIILDAVLTTEGRRALAANDGSFRITHFSLGDDEVDYSIITKFGRAVGREKIEKNTPIFEALTDENLEARSRLVTISDDTEMKMATLTVRTTTPITFSNVISTNKTTSDVNIEQTGPDGQAIATEIQDSVLQVSVDHRFLEVRGVRPFSSTGNISHYNVITANTQEQNPTFTFTLVPKTLISADFTTYGSTADKTSINTVVRVQGKQSGLFKDISATLNKN